MFAELAARSGLRLSLTAVADPHGADDRSSLKQKRITEANGRGAAASMRPASGGRRVPALAWLLTLAVALIVFLPSAEVQSQIPNLLLSNLNQPHSSNTAFSSGGNA